MVMKAARGERIQEAFQEEQTRRVATTAIITRRNTEKIQHRMVEDIEALALSNDRVHLRAGNGPTAHGRLSTQWDRVCRNVKTLVNGICAYKSYLPAKILPPDAASYCALPGPISVNFGPGPIRRRFIDARFRTLR